MSLSELQRNIRHFLKTRSKEIAVLLSKYNVRFPVIYTTMIHANVKPQYVYAAIRLLVGFKEMLNKRQRDINRKAT